MERCSEHVMLAKSVQDIANAIALLQKDIEYLRRDTETVLSRLGAHVNEADAVGGWHDRVRAAETGIAELRRQRQMDMIMARWFMIGSGVIGGLIGAGAPEAVRGIATVMGVHI